MISSDHDRRADLAAPNEFVNSHPKLRPLAIAEPADTRRQSLKLNSLLRELHPTREHFVLRKKFERERVRPGRQLLQAVVNRAPGAPQLDQIASGGDG